MAESRTATTRRAWLLGDRSRPRGLRPPWAAVAFDAACTGCGRCIDACPEAVLKLGARGVVEVEVRQGSGSCTFCAACVESCPEPAFDRGRQPPWDVTARIGEGCLARGGVHCQSCGDACPEQAIRFGLRLGGPPVPDLDALACTGCGACVGTCPAAAISLAEAGHG